MAFVLTMTFGLGLYMVDMPFSPDKLRYYSWHKWIGVSLFMLAGLRLAVRLATSRVPETISRRNSSSVAKAGWQDMAATWAHRLLYFLMFAVPVSGWLMSSAKGVPTVYFGVWQLPDLVDKNVALGRSLRSLHMLLNFSMAGIVFVHVAAALKHHLIDRDNVLARMLPGLKTRSAEGPQ